jgi:lysophospholipase L1-like esterase
MLLVAFEEYNRVIRAVAQQTGALLVEGEDSIPADDRHFADSVHFRDAGAAAMARRVNEALFNDDTLKKLVNTGR